MPRGRRERNDVFLPNLIGVSSPRLTAA